MIILWNVKTAHVNRKEPIQNFGSFFISLYGFITAKFSHKIIQFNNNGLTTFQNFLLPLIFLVCDIKAFSLTFSQKFTHKFHCLLDLLLFFSVLFLRKIFLSFALCMVAFGIFSFIKGEWLPLTNLFFRGAYWSKILLQDI